MLWIGPIFEIIDTITRRFRPEEAKRILKNRLAKLENETDSLLKKPDTLSNRRRHAVLIDRMREVKDKLKNFP